jgi:hypothetical protein
MNFLFNIVPIMTASGYKAVTSRGNALHTVDWYMHGKPSMQEYDNLDIQLKNLAK